MKTYEAIIKGENIPDAGIPESFKVLLKELQALGLDVRVLDENREEVELKENIDYGDNTDPRFETDFDGKYDADASSLARGGYQTQEFEGDELVAVESDEYESDFDGDDFDVDDDDQ